METTWTYLFMQCWQVATELRSNISSVLLNTKSFRHTHSHKQNDSGGHCWERNQLGRAKWRVIVLPLFLLAFKFILHKTKHGLMKGKDEKE